MVVAITLSSEDEPLPVYGIYVIFVGLEFEVRDRLIISFLNNSSFFQI